MSSNFLDDENNKRYDKRNGNNIDSKVKDKETIKDNQDSNNSKHEESKSHSTVPVEE